MDRNPEKSKKPVKKKGKKINKSFINKKRKSANDLYKINESEISTINKKTNSDGDKDVKNKINIWNRQIKTLKMSETGEITKKLDKDDLILNNLQLKAIEKIKKANNLDEIINALSYDNVNKNIVYFCLKKIKTLLDLNETNKWLNNYKYCLSNEIYITDYFNDNKITKLNLEKEFNYNFPFKNLDESLNTLIVILKNLIELTNLFFENINTNKTNENLLIY